MFIPVPVGVQEKGQSMFIPVPVCLQAKEHSMFIPVPVGVQLEDREHLHMSVSQLRQELLRRTMYLHQSQENLQAVREATSLRGQSAFLPLLALKGIPSKEAYWPQNIELCKLFYLQPSLGGLVNIYATEASFALQI